MKAILLAGGRGTRMGSLTNDTPKPLLLLGGTPLIERGIEKVVRAGVNEVVISTGYLAEQFEAVLGDGSKWGIRIQYSVEDSPLGTGGAMSLAAHRFLDQDENVVVMNADLISDHDVLAHIKHHVINEADATIHVRQVDDPRRFGVVEFDAHSRVSAFIEKPDFVMPSWINAGTYVVRSKVLWSLPEAVQLSWERDVMPEL